ncbi:MAG: TIM barrel protein [Candidatus Hydrogenedens sp.]|nr:TIM barrel protein [Candidatus Hydrogenedens sp.]
MASKIDDLSRLCIHTATTNPLSLEEAVAAYADAGVPYITVWEHHLKPLGAKKAAKLIQDAGLKVASLCRGGFFVAAGAQARQDAINHNRHLIDAAAELGAPVLVLVCGADPDVEMPVARQQIADGIHALDKHAQERGVKLAIEPLHPMYADTRSAINTLDQANNLVMALDSKYIGVAVDVYHLWWDPFLRAEIKRATGTIFAFHVCDWRVPTRDLLNDRALMGAGCIPVRQIREWVEDTGFDGPIEVEIFSEEEWGKDQGRWIKRIKTAYMKSV